MTSRGGISLSPRLSIISIGVAADVVGMFESWVAEDENNYLLDDNWGNRGNMAVVCNFAVQIILKSKLGKYYDFALECCDKGIAASESPLVDERIAQEDITMFQGFKREILAALEAPNLVDYRSLLKEAIRSMKGPDAPKMAEMVSPGVVKRAIASYAPAVFEKSVVAIDGAGFPSRGKSGVLYTGEGLFSSEVQKGAILKYSKIGSVSKRDDGLLFKMRDGSERVLRFGDYQDSVYEVLTRLIKMRSSR